jgi:hypothetical protein
VDSVPEEETYTLEVRDAQGTTVFSGERLAEPRNYPNGPECDETFCTGITVAM